MLELIDSSLEALLRAGVPLSAQDIDVSFDAPDREWSAKLNRPTVNLFLWEIKKSTTQARSGVEHFERAGVPMRRFALPRVELRYMLTAWTSDQRDERSLLSGLLRTVLANGDMPETFMPQDLSDLSGITINLASSGAGVPTDLFKTLDGRLKPALDVLVVTDIDTFIETPLASSPAAVNIGFGDSTLPSRRDDFRRVAGEVRVPDAVGALVRSPLGTAIVNAASRFLINAAPGDEIVVELAVPLTAVVPERGGIVIG